MGLAGGAYWLELAKNGEAYRADKTDFNELVVAEAGTVVADLHGRGQHQMLPPRHP